MKATSDQLLLHQMHSMHSKYGAPVPDLSKGGPLGDTKGASLQFPPPPMQYMGHSMLSGAHNLSSWQLAAH